MSAFRQILIMWIVVLLVVIIWGGRVFFSRGSKAETARSPQRIQLGKDLVKIEYGITHAFEQGVVLYTVERHVVRGDREMTVCVSGEKGVEIWSSIPDFFLLPDKSQFIFSGPGDWNDVFCASSVATNNIVACDIRPPKTTSVILEDFFYKKMGLW